METSGWIYCLSNPCMTGIIKIGSTKYDPNKRAIQLYTTGVPMPFVLEYSRKVCSYKKVEKRIHRMLRQYRVSDKREFFRIEFHIIKILIERICIDEEKQAKETAEVMQAVKEIRIAPVSVLSVKVASDDKEYKCFKCGKTFRNECIISIHMARRHPCGIVTDVDIGRYWCIDCNKAFVDECRCGKHKMIYKPIMHGNKIIKLEDIMHELQVRTATYYGGQLLIHEKTEAEHEWKEEMEILWKDINELTQLLPLYE